MTLHMCGLGLGLVPYFWVGVHRRFLCFHCYSTFRELQKNPQLFFPMLTCILFINIQDRWSIGFGLPHICAVHPDPPNVHVAL